jgi:hypothetical protein
VNLLVDRSAWFLPFPEFFVKFQLNHTERHLRLFGRPLWLCEGCTTRLEWTISTSPAQYTSSGYVLSCAASVPLMALPLQPDLRLQSRGKLLSPDKKHLRKAKSGDYEQPHSALVLKELSQLRTQSMSKNLLLQASGWKQEQRTCDSI